MKMRIDEFEGMLDELSYDLTLYLRSLDEKISSSEFENEVRKHLAVISRRKGYEVDMAPPAQEFPDILYHEFGIEVKFTTSDSWRSIANSIFEGRRNACVQHVYLLFGKNGGNPEVKWNRYEDCIMHVRTSHVPRFEVEIDTEAPLFKKLGVSYEAFRVLPPEDKMPYIRSYAKARLKKGERLWWIEDHGEPHTLSLEVSLYTQLSSEEKRRYRAEAAVLSPGIVRSSRARGKYDDATMYLLTYHGILCNQARDLFSAGSVAMRSDPSRGGNYIKRALEDIELEIRNAVDYLEDALFEEYWGFTVDKKERMSTWLYLLDESAKGWKPSEELFRN